MEENINRDEKTYIPENKETHKESKKTMFSKIEDSGIRYINQQKHYLLISGIIPLFIMIIEILNIYFIVNHPKDSFHPPLTPLPGSPLPQQQPLPSDAIIPTIVLLVLAIFALYKFIVQFGWKKNLNQYNQIQRKIDKEKSPDNINYAKRGKLSLTKLFYNMISQMEKIKYIFYGLNVIFIFSLQWVFNFFFKELSENLPGIEIIGEVMKWVNLAGSILLIVYFIIEWIHFRRWNSKLQDLKSFEKRVFEELNLDD